MGLGGVGFGESQVYRIDHFLGKESVDNILAFRFANGLFEPVRNRDHISYVQIDVPETLSIAGRGGGSRRAACARSSGSLWPVRPGRGWR